MLKIIFNIFASSRMIFILSKYQIFHYNNHTLKSSFIYNFLKFISYIIYPLNLISSNVDPFSIRLNKALKLLGPTYIKLGQIISTRPDIVGAEIADMLKELQDKLEAFENEIAFRRFRQVFGKEMSEVFSYIKSEPVAAASISQVYYAKTFEDTEVAVKFLRPNIAKYYQEDLDLQKFIASLIMKFASKTKRLKLLEVNKILQNVMHNELDLRLEASAASELSQNFAKDTSVHIPKVYWDYTSKEILTTEWIDGISIYNKEELINNGINLIDLSSKIAIMSFNQTYRDGFFHADLHPGNILITKSGKIGLVDFGIMGRLANKDRVSIAQILYYFTQKNYIKVAEIHAYANFIPKGSDLNLFAQYCRAIAEPIFGLAIKDISMGKILTQLFEVTEEFGMEIQPQLLLLQKNMIIIEGIGQMLNPDINMWHLIEPWITTWVAKNISPEAMLIKKCKTLLNNIIAKITDENS
jgi:ubiquinone biosynthesis protein